MRYIKTTLTLVGYLIVFFVAFNLMMVGMYEVGFESAVSSERMARVKENCRNRGGEWIVNPNSIIPHAIYGQGCNIDYNTAK